MSYEHLAVSTDGGVQTVLINRPDRLNALTPGVADELTAAFEAASADDAVRAVVLSGEGRAFTSGADLKAGTETQLESGRPDFGHALVHNFNPALRAMRALPKPVVAAVHGPCVGIGVAYALASDLVVAGPDAYLLLSFATIGLVPDGGLSCLIPARAGAGRFARMALLGERITGAQAFEWGLADFLEDDPKAKAAELAATLARGAVGSYASTKRMVNEGALAGYGAALDLEAELQRTRGDSDEFVEGVSAFLEKRAPDFAKVAPR